MSEERRSALSEDDINRIVDAVANKTKEAFHIEEEVHYNQHKRLDKLLDAYDTATSMFVRGFLALVIAGSLVLAGIGFVKGGK
ncbi:MAG: hypothetical protein AABY01_01070 [Nanoarchaeota archaeon]